MRADWGSADRSSARRRPTSHLPEVRARCRNRIGAARQLPEFVRNVNEDGVGEGCGLLVVEKETILTVLPTSTSPRMDVNPSSPADRPFKSLLPQSMPTHLSFAHSCCLLRDAPRAQSDSRSWTFWIPLMLWSYQHLVSRFSQRSWDARSQESRPVALHVL